MIKWLLNKRLAKKLFSDEKRFRRQVVSFNRDFYIRQADKIRQAIIDGNKKEAEQRQKSFTDVGMLPPKTLQCCEKIVNELTKWRP